MVTGIGWSRDFADDWYVYPYLKGEVYNLPIKFVNAYGGNLMRLLKNLIAKGVSVRLPNVL
jgi:hypothetical protein